jgi:acyl-CoA synthetase (NDP forming)
MLDLMLSDPDVDSVLVTGAFGVYGAHGGELARGEMETAHRMVQVARSHGKLVAVHTMRAGSPAARVLAENHLPVFSAIEDAVRALSVVSAGAVMVGIPLEVATAPAVSGDSYWDARQLLADAGVSFPNAELVDSVNAAVRAGERLGYPVVLKAMGLLHKSDSGGVALSLGDASELRAAYTDMDARISAPQYCVEAMADIDNGVELIVGVQTDPRFGPVAMVGLGGIMTEVLEDIVVALAPVDVIHARRMLESLRAAAILQGARGREPVDVEAAACAIATIARLVAAHREISEMEVNPLLASPIGATGLDARIVLDPAESAPQ